MKKAIATIIIGLSIFGLMAPGVVLAADEVVKLAILPFKVNADRDLTLLQAGIVDMLTSRLSRSENVEIIPHRILYEQLGALDETIDEALARKIGEGLGLDHVLYGSITSIGAAVSVDTQMVSIGTAIPARSFYIQAASLGEVIPKINGLTAEINRQVFGFEDTTAVAPPAPQQPTAPHRKHPEKQFALKKIPPAASRQAPAAEQGPFIQSVQPQAGQFWRSQAFRLHLNGLAIGDVDGDGINETVIVSKHQIHLFRVEGGQLIKVSETGKDRSRIHIGVDLADINGNGRPEIFVTALDVGRNRVRSLITETDGVSFDTIEEASPWYYRVSKMPEGNPVLLGQKPFNEDPFAAPVYQLEWNGSNYEPKQQVVPKKTSNALGCAVGDLLNNGNRYTVAFNSADAILIFDEEGRLVSNNNDGYGGNIQAAKLPVNSPGEPPPLKFLPMRLMITDLDGDGQNEVVTVKNKDFTGKHLARFRYFTKTRMVGLNWDGAGMAEIWQTRELSGRIADMTVADLEGDGRMDLVAILMTKEGNMVGMKPQASLIAYPLN